MIPYIVFGDLAAALLPLARDRRRSIFTLSIGHIVIPLPYTILVLVPRLTRSTSPRGSGIRPRRGALRTFRSIILPLILPGDRVGLPDLVHASFDEYAVASFVAARTTFPIYLYGALRFPSRLPQVIAVAVVVMVVSLVVVVGAEIGRRVAERRLGAARALTCGPAPTGAATGVPGANGVGRSSARRCETRYRGVSTWNCVNMPRIDDLRDRPDEPRPVLRRVGAGAVRSDALGPHRDAHASPARTRRLAATTIARRRRARDGDVADELGDVDVERVQRADEIRDERRRGRS